MRKLSKLLLTLVFALSISSTSYAVTVASWGGAYTESQKLGYVDQSAKKLGINWKSGLSPFRKWSISRMEELKILTEKQMDNRFGNSKDVRQTNYLRDLNLNEKQRKAAINQIAQG